MYVDYLERSDGSRLKEESVSFLKQQKPIVLESSSSDRSGSTAVVSMMCLRVTQKSLGPRSSWCGSRWEVGRGQDLVVRISIICRHILGVGSSSSSSIHPHLYTLRILVPLLVVFISLLLQHSVYVQSWKSAFGAKTNPLQTENEPNQETIMRVR